MISSRAAAAWKFICSPGSSGLSSSSGAARPETGSTSSTLLWLYLGARDATPLLSLPFAEHSDPTEVQLEWQMMTNLAYGSKGLQYVSLL